MRTRAAAATLGALLLGACNSLDVANPNAPDASRALADPAAIEQVAAGTLRTWFNTFDGMEGGGPLNTMAQAYSASWNNYNMNFYSSIDADGTRNTRAFKNDLASSERTTMIAYWQGYYSVISSAVDVLTAIRKDKGLSQGDLAKQIGIMGVVLGRYERDEVKPSIEVAAKIAQALGVSLDYLVGNSEVLLDKDLIKRITEIQQLSEADRQGIFFALDGLLRDAKARKAYA